MVQLHWTESKRPGRQGPSCSKSHSQDGKSEEPRIITAPTCGDGQLPPSLLIQHRRREGFRSAAEHPTRSPCKRDHRQQLSGPVLLSVWDGGGKKEWAKDTPKLSPRWEDHILTQRPLQQGSQNHPVHCITRGWPWATAASTSEHMRLGKSRKRLVSHTPLLAAQGQGPKQGR